MITIVKEFTDAEVMDGFIKSYLKEFPPAGYDTNIEIWMAQTYEEWENNLIRYAIKITRLESCD